MSTSLEGVKLFMKAILDQKPWLLDSSLVPKPWTRESLLRKDQNGTKKLRVGVLPDDGVVKPHPPILRVLDEVARSLKSAGIDVVEMDITPLFSQCQSLANALFGVEGGNAMFDLLESANEPLSPWLKTRLRRKEALSLDNTRKLHAKRTELQKKFLTIWKDVNGIDIDAFIFDR